MHQLRNLRDLGVRPRRISLFVLRQFLRLVPNENHRVFAVALLTGAVCGLAAVSFHLLILWMERQFIDRAANASGGFRLALTILLPTLGGLICGVVLQYLVPGARGSGIPQIKVAYAVKGGRVPFRDAVGKFLVGALQIGSGASLGREGPTVQICAGVASTLGRIFGLSRENLRRLLPVGAAAGIAAAFNAPIAAVTFTIEEIVGDLDQAVLAWIVVAAAIAAAVERSILGEHPVFTLSSTYSLAHASSLLSYAILGVAAAAVALLFSSSLIWLRRRFQRLSFIPGWARPGVGGFVTGVMAVVALLWIRAGGINGGGYGTLSDALSGKLALQMMLVLCLLKLIATVFSYSSGGAGGIFAPVLFIGGMLGGAAGYFDRFLLTHSSDQIGAFALVGMGAVFAAVIRAPITSVLIIFEMTGSYNLILPLMISNMTAYALAKHFHAPSVYEDLLHQDGVYLPDGDLRLSHALDRLRVKDAMTGDPISLSRSQTVTQALAVIGRSGFSTYPVTDDTQKFIGFVSEIRLRRAVAEGADQKTIDRLVSDPNRIDEHAKLVKAAVRMERAGVRRLAVVDRHREDRFVGLITLSDIVRTHARAAIAVGDPDRTIDPEFAEAARVLETK